MEPKWKENGVQTAKASQRVRSGDKKKKIGALVYLNKECTYNNWSVLDHFPVSGLSVSSLVPRPSKEERRLGTRLECGSIFTDLHT